MDAGAPSVHYLARQARRATQSPSLQYLARNARRVAEAALEVLLPSRCLACGALVVRPGSLCAASWSES